MFSIPLEFRVIEREAPYEERDEQGNIVLRRGKKKAMESERWFSTWILWDDGFDVTVFTRNLQRELASIGLAASREVERNIIARIDEFKILNNLVDAAPPMVPFTPSSGLSSPDSAKKRKLASFEGRTSVPASISVSSLGNGEQPVKRGRGRPRKYPRPEDLATGATAVAAAAASTSATLISSGAAKSSQSTPRSTSSPLAPRPNSHGGLGKGHKRCKYCDAVIASFRRECPECRANLVK